MTAAPGTLGPIGQNDLDTFSRMFGGQDMVDITLTTPGEPAPNTNGLPSFSVGGVLTVTATEGMAASAAQIVATHGKRNSENYHRFLNNFIRAVRLPRLGTNLFGVWNAYGWRATVDLAALYVVFLDSNMPAQTRDFTGAVDHARIIDVDALAPASERVINTSAWALENEDGSGEPVEPAEVIDSMGQVVRSIDAAYIAVHAALCDAYRRPAHAGRYGDVWGLLARIDGVRTDFLTAYAMVQQLTFTHDLLIDDRAQTARARRESIADTLTRTTRRNPRPRAYRPQR